MSVITERTLIVSDRDIKKKASCGNYMVIDIKAGTPFYPRRVNRGYGIRPDTITVPAFAAHFNEYPLEWFSPANTK